MRTGLTVRSWLDPKFDGLLTRNLTAYNKAPRASSMSLRGFFILAESAKRNECHQYFMIKRSATGLCSKKFKVCSLFLSNLIVDRPVGVSTPNTIKTTSSPYARKNVLSSSCVLKKSILNIQCNRSFPR